MPSNKWLMKHQKQNGTTRTDLTLILIFGTTLADMKSRKENPTRILWKQIMPNFVTISHAWLAGHVASRDAHAHFVVPYASLLSVSTVGNSTNNASPNIQHISWTSSAHDFSHSEFPYSDDYVLLIPFQQFVRQ
jgi:hypothetical protein